MLATKYQNSQNIKHQHPLSEIIKNTRTWWRRTSPYNDWSIVLLERMEGWRVTRSWQLKCFTPKVARNFPFSAQERVASHVYKFKWMTRGQLQRRFRQIVWQQKIRTARKRRLAYHRNKHFTSPENHTTWRRSDSSGSQKIRLKYQ